MPFNYQQALKLRQQRQEQIRRWKRVSEEFFPFELTYDNLKDLDKREALEDAIDEMPKEDIVALVQSLMKAIKNEAAK